MSKTETKRGLVAPQGGVSAIATSTPAWDAAVAVLKAEKQHVLDHPAQDVRQSYHDAVDRVLGTPAPNGAALAYKVGLQTLSAGVIKHPDRAFDELLGAFTPQAIQNIFAEGEDDEKAALALYFDAMALADVVVSVEPPAIAVGNAWPKVWAEYLAADAASLAAALADEDDDDTTVSDRYLAARRAVLEHDAPNWAAVAAKLRALGDMIGCDPVEQPDPTSVRCGAGPEALTQVYLAYEQTAALGEANPGDCNRRAVALTLLATEGLAKIMAATGYAQFAINPEGLSEIALAVTAIQRDARSLSHEIAHGFAAPALDRVWRDDDGDDEPNPPGAKAPADDELVAAIDTVVALETQVQNLTPYSDEAASALTAAQAAPTETALAMRASTLSGLLARARLVQLHIPGPDHEEFSQVHWRVVWALLDDLRALAGFPETDPTEWLEARALHDKARAAYEGAEAAEVGEEEIEQLHGAYCVALEAWEATPPPSIRAMAEVMGVSLQFNGLDWIFGRVDDPRSIRDLLDADDTHQIFAGRFYLHTLRLAGSTTPALSTSPEAQLYPSFYTADHEGYVSADGGPGERKARWERYHATKESYPRRAAGLLRWEAKHGPDASRLAAPEAEG